MIHKVEIGDIWESVGFIKTAYLILEIEEDIIHVLNLYKDEMTFVYGGFFMDDDLFTWKKV